MRTESNGGEEEVGADADHRLRTEARETTSTAAPGRAAVGEEGEVVTASTTEGSGSSKLSYDPTAMANLERRRKGDAADLGEGARVLRRKRGTAYKARHRGDVARSRPRSGCSRCTREGEEGFTGGESERGEKDEQGARKKKK